MVDWSDLLLPSVLSAVLIFFASFLIHAVLRLHSSQHRKLSNEDDVRAVMRKGSPTAGIYVIPYCRDGKEMSSPEMIKKVEEGPNGVLFIRPPHKPNIGPFLAKWVVYTLAVSFVVGYIGRSVLEPGASYLEVFRIVGTSAWLAYAWQGPADSIWMGKPWNLTWRGMIDGLLYACLTAGSFGWLWPKVVAP